MKSQPIVLRLGDTCLESSNVEHIQHMLTLLAPGAVIVRAPSATPALGEVWPGQGGVFAGTVRGRDGKPSHHLIVAPENSEGINLQYGGRGQVTEGADSPWDGKANTEALNNAESSHPAAEFAACYEREGHSDYYLGSHAEMGIAWANVPELFSKTWYWTSSQSSANDAWLQYFGDGYQCYYDEYNEGRVRPVRQIPVH